MDGNVVVQLASDTATGTRIDVKHAAQLRGVGVCCFCHVWVVGIESVEERKMEAHHEKREQERREEETKKKDPMWKAKEVIRQSIVGGGDQVEKESAAATATARGVAKEADDILVYNRAVHKLDSSLE